MSSATFRWQAVIFDMDGTLADTSADIAAGLDHSLAAAGLSRYSRETYRSFVGGGVEHLVDRLLPGAAPGLRDRVLAEYRRYDEDHNPRKACRYPGVDLLLDGLTARNVPMAILSNKPQESLDRVVHQLFARWPFVQVRGEREGTPKKPEPTVAVALACAMRTSPSHCLFVGDTEVDVRTACAAGMIPVGVAWGFRTRLQLEAAGAWRVVEHPLQLLQLAAGKAA